MTTVFDGSALVAALAGSGRERQWAESLLAADSAAGPELVMAEVTNVLRRLERAGKVSRSQAASAARHVLRLEIELFPFAPFASRVWELRHSLTAYDAWYVAVAKMHGGRLATLDRRLCRATGPRCEIVLPPLDD